MRCYYCGCTLLSCQCAAGPTNDLLEDEELNDVNYGDGSTEIDSDDDSETEGSE